MKYNIWSLAEERMHTLYGTEIPSLILAWYQREKSRLQNTDVEMLLAFLCHLAQHFDALKAAFTLRGRIGASFVCWLLGISEVNPLPPHYYCPRCQCVQFTKQKKYGWDLPEKPCSCGENMLHDGMNTVYLAEIDLKKRIQIDVDISDELQEDVQRQLLTFFPDQLFIRAGFMDDEMVKYVFLPKTDKATVDPPDKMIRMNYCDAPAEAYPYPSIQFYKSRQDTLLWQLCKKSNVSPKRIPWRSPDNTRSYLQYELPGFLYDNVCDNAALIKDAHPGDFSGLLLFLGFDHATIEGYDEIKAAVRSHPQTIYELDVFCEDVYDRIHSHLEQKGIADDSLAVHVADQARLGKYIRSGVGKETQTKLLSIGISEEYFHYLSKVRYLFPRGHMLTRLVRNLRLAWFCLNMPVAWEESQAARYAEERE